MIPPIAIGAVGGSGTRVIADFLIKAGIHMGQELNSANDNLWFTFLFKRPRWFASFPEAAEIHSAMALFQKASTVGLRGTITASEEALLQQIAAELRSTSRPIGIGADCIERLLASQRVSAKPDEAWGWKEPNTQIFLPELARSVPGFRYIHVLRNGFDMAFSRNTQQARNWSGSLFESPLAGEAISQEQILDYWIAANRRTLSQGQSLLGSRFFVLCYEALCDHPEREIQRLFDFLDRPIPKTVHPDQIKPRSRGRYLDQDLSRFTPAQKDAVAEIMTAAEAS